MFSPSFQASKEDFEKAVFANNGADFFTFTEGTDGPQDGVASYTAFLESAGTNSNISIAVKADKCGDAKYECKVTAAGEESIGETTVKVTGQFIIKIRIHLFLCITFILFYI